MNGYDNSFSLRSKALAPNLVKALLRRNFEAYYCENAETAVEKALSLIPENSSVTWGGSVTIQEIGLLDRIRAGNYRVIDRDTAATIENRLDLMRQAFFCDFYLTSVNALSEDGQLVNVDGMGNRVAAMAFGPKNVIVIAGMNKLCKTLNEAEIRAKTYAGPLNAQRILNRAYLKPAQTLPCAVNGICSDCKVEACICAVTATTRMCKIPNRIKIILVGQSLGY